MKKFIFIIIAIAVLVIVAKKMFMGGPPPGMMGEMPPPVVELTRVKKEEIIDKIETTGRIEAVKTVDLVARVDGYLQKSYFEEGSFVKQGDLLFLIEPDRYKIAVQQAKADLETTRAMLNEADKNLVRVSDLVEKDFVSKSQYDDAVASRDSLGATLEAKTAQLDNAELNLMYTKIFAPITGKIGRIRIQEGNYVTQVSGSIARIVSLDPIYANFNLRVEDYLKIKKEGDDFKNRLVEIFLPDGSKYPVNGKIEFLNNEIDQSTGTIQVRALFQNDKSILLPGQYVSVINYSPKTENVNLIEQEAVLDSSKGKYVYIVDEEKKAQIRPVQVEKQYKDYWVLKSGIKEGEKVILKGVQKVRPNSPVMLKSDMQQGPPGKGKGFPKDKMKGPHKGKKPLKGEKPDEK